MTFPRIAFWELTPEATIQQPDNSSTGREPNPKLGDRDQSIGQRDTFGTEPTKTP